MSGAPRMGMATTSPGGRFHCAMDVAIVLGCLAVVASAPVRAETFPRTLSVNGRVDTITVLKGTRFRLEWNFPTATPGRVPHWAIGVAARPITCDEAIAAAVAPGASHPGTWTIPLSLERSGSAELDTSGPEWPAGASYYVRGCLRLDGGRHHETNQVEIRLTTAVGAPVVAPLPGMPQITGTLAAAPVRPGYWIGVTGRDFGDRPGQLLLQTGTTTHRLNELDWHSRAIAGRIPRIEGIADGPATLIVERADGARSLGRSVSFVATREVRLVPGGEVHVDSCAEEADTNKCGTLAYPGAPSFDALHASILVIDVAGESGIDQFSIPLANGWKFHDLGYSRGNRETPPRWAVRDGGSTRPHIQVHWRNPGGWDVRVIYGFDLYIIGPAGVPHR